MFTSCSFPVLCAIVMAPSALDSSGVSSHLDKSRDDARRMLELQLFQEMDRTLANGCGEQRPDRGHTPSDDSRHAVRFSSCDTRRSPRVAPSIRESSYRSREELRFEAGQPRQMGPRRSRSLTPDGGERSLFAAQVGRAGVVSNNPRRFDTPAGRSEALGNTRLRQSDYHRRYDQNAAGTSLPGARPWGMAESDSSMRRSSSLQKSLSKGSDLGRAAPKVTTSKAVKEELRFFLQSQEGAPERMGKRVSDNWPAQSSTPRTQSYQRPSFGGPPEPRWDGVALSSPSGRSQRGEVSARGGRDRSPPETLGPMSYEPPPRRAADASKSSARKQAVTSYMPGSNDSMGKGRFGGSHSASNMHRDIWGRDAFASSLRA